MWTIFNSQGIAIANCDGEPNHQFLSARGERAYLHEESIGLSEAWLVDEVVKRKPLVRLAANVDGTIATVTVSCDDENVVEVPLSISGTPVKKPVGNFTIVGEVSISVRIDFERDQFRGDALEVIF